MVYFVTDFTKKTHIEIVQIPFMLKYDHSQTRIRQYFILFVVIIIYKMIYLLVLRLGDLSTLNLTRLEVL